MQFYHVMIRVSDLDQSIRFFALLGMREIRRLENPEQRYTLVFLAAEGDAQRAQLELTYNWDERGYGSGRNFGHIALWVDDIYVTCQHLQNNGVVINRPPRDGFMAFVRSPDNISIELVQKGEALARREPWMSMPNVGTW
jgi:Lactoylglutathione lyase and related lyases|nr:VOC family protein [uncultured Steroidobacter sp.]